MIHVNTELQDIILGKSPTLEVDPVHTHIWLSSVEGRRLSVPEVVRVVCWAMHPLLSLWFLQIK